MNRSTRKLLQILSDGKWHRKVPGVRAKIVEICIERGLVHTKRVDLKHDGHIESYRIALHITKKGKAVFEKDE